MQRQFSLPWPHHPSVDTHLPNDKADNPALFFSLQFFNIFFKGKRFLCKYLHGNRDVAG